VTSNPLYRPLWSGLQSDPKSLLKVPRPPLGGPRAGLLQRAAAGCRPVRKSRLFLALFTEPSHGSLPTVLDEEPARGHVVARALRVPLATKRY